MRRWLIPATVPLLALPVFGGVALAQGGTVDVSLDCYSTPERVIVTNNTSSALTVTSIASIDDPQRDQVFRPNASIGAGQSATFESGSAATANRLTEQLIFDNENPSEGVVVMTTAGQVVVRCTQRTESVAAGQPPADSPPTTPTPAASVVADPVGKPIVLPVEPDGGIGDGAGPPGSPTGPTPSIAVVGGATPGPGEAVITGGQKGAPIPAQAPGKAAVAPAQAPGQAGAAPAQAPGKAGAAPAQAPGKAAAAPAQAPERPAAKPAAVAPAQAPAGKAAVAPAPAPVAVGSGAPTALPRTGGSPIEALVLFGSLLAGAGTAARRFIR